MLCSGKMSPKHSPGGCRAPGEPGPSIGPGEAQEKCSTKTVDEMGKAASLFTSDFYSALGFRAAECRQF